MAHLFVELPQEAVSFSGESSFSPLPSDPSVSLLLSLVLLHLSSLLSSTEEEWTQAGRQASVTFLMHILLGRGWRVLFLGLFLPGCRAVSRRKAWFPPLWMWLWTTHGRTPAAQQNPEPGSAGTGTGSPALPPSSSHKEPSNPFVCWLSVRLSSSGPFVRDSGGRCLRVHSLGFVRCTYNMPPTSISEM